MACVNRREFLETASGLVVLTSREGQAAASERVRVAVIGAHGRGTDHAQMLASNPGAEVVAVCDVDDATFERPIRIVQVKTGKAPRVEKDFRRLLDDKSIDTITIAAPDHWHALMTVLACQAGKEVMSRSR
jgi:predicted dehydrogenase